MVKVTHGSRESWLRAVWEVIWEVEEASDRGTIMPVELDDVKTAMAWIAEELEVNQEDL